MIYINCPIRKGIQIPMNLRIDGIVSRAGIQAYKSLTVRVVVSRPEMNQGGVFVSLPDGDDHVDMAKSLNRMYIKGLRVFLMDSVS